MKQEKRIFILEDDRELADILTQQLKGLGYRVCGVTANPADAVALIEQSRPDVILLDIEVNGTFSGLEIGSYLVSKTDIPFVYITGHDDPQILQRARETIPDGYLLKPFNARQLNVAIEMAGRDG